MLSSWFPRTSRLLAVAMLIPGASWAALTWQSREIDLQAKAGDDSVTTLFRFTNTGEAPVTITSVEASCGCTTATPGKPTYAPGESGEIKVVFTLGERTGPQEKTIQVVTTEAPTTPDTLLLKVDIVERLSSSLRLLLWRKDAPATAKSVTLTAAAGQQITAIEPDPATASHASIKITAIEPGTRFEINVQPASLREVASVPLNFTAHFADGSTQRVTLYMLVK